MPGFFLIPDAVPRREVSRLYGECPVFFLILDAVPRREVSRLYGECPVFFLIPDSVPRRELSRLRRMPGFFLDSWLWVLESNP
jgi:hypothetical protein